MNPPPLILLADQRTLKAFASEGGQRIRLIDDIAIAGAPSSSNRRLSRDSFAKQAAGHVMQLLQTHQPKSWAFAAPPEVNGAILDGLSPKWLSTLQDNLPRDLNHESPRNLSKLFQRPLN